MAIARMDGSWSTPRIRAYDRRRDAEALVGCVASLQRLERELEPGLAREMEPPERYVDAMLRRCAVHRGRVFVADEGGGLAGFVCVLGRVVERAKPGPSVAHAMVGELYVDVAWRGQGVGRGLLEHAEAHGRACGAHSLRVQVLAGNRGARELYRGFGFHERLVELDKPLG